MSQNAASDSAARRAPCKVARAFYDVLARSAPPAVLTRLQAHLPALAATSDDAQFGRWRAAIAATDAPLYAAQALRAAGLPDEAGRVEDFDDKIGSVGDDSRYALDLFRRIHRYGETARDLVGTAKTSEGNDALRRARDATFYAAEAAASAQAWDRAERTLATMLSR